ncbi:hypothetical protein AQ740_15075 [Burkholderia pseudomallei]|nr:hypothetical protein AQ740_15075 [Burkholderia pseudomallei]
MTPGARAMCVPAGAAWGTVSGGGPSVTSDAAIAIEACANATTSKLRAYAASATRASRAR